MGRPLRDISLGTTTLVVRNIPTRYTQEMLLAELGLAAWVDILFRPYSFSQKRNLGHAILNFITPEAAIGFQRRWHGKRLRDHGRTRALDIAMSDVQGYAAVLLQFGPRVLATRNPAILPVILHEGQRLDAKLEVARVQAVHSHEVLLRGTCEPQPVQRVPKASRTPGADTKEVDAAGSGHANAALRCASNEAGTCLPVAKQCQIG